jgi:hypothetical protein
MEEELEFAFFLSIGTFLFPNSSLLFLQSEFGVRHIATLTSLFQAHSEDKDRKQNFLFQFLHCRLRIYCLRI